MTSQEEARKDFETRRRAARAPLFAGIFPPKHVPTWGELADAAETLRVEGALRASSETLIGAAAREARLEVRRARRKRDASS